MSGYVRLNHFSRVLCKLCNFVQFHSIRLVPLVENRCKEPSTSFRSFRTISAEVQEHIVDPFQILYFHFQSSISIVLSKNAGTGLINYFKTRVSLLDNLFCHLSNSLPAKLK